MEKNITDRIPFRVESPRGDDILGTNEKTGEIISDFDAKTQRVPFQSGIPRDKIQKAIEDALKQEKWVCIEKQDGSTELLTKKDLPMASNEKPVEVAAANKAEQPEEPSKPVKEDWKEVLNGASSPAQKPVVMNQMITPNSGNLKEQQECKLENIKSATATNKGKGG